MAWTAPMTAVANSVFTAAQFNTHVRDNLLETGPAKATTAGRLIVTTAANAVTERAVVTQAVTTSQSTGATSYSDLTTVGPTRTVTTGANAIAIISSEITNDTSGARSFVGVAVSGASAVAASDDDCIRFQAPGAFYSHRGSAAVMFDSLTPGSNTFTMKYRVDSGTATFQRRRLIVIAL